MKDAFSRIKDNAQILLYAFSFIVIVIGFGATIGAQEAEIRNQADNLSTIATTTQKYETSNTKVIDAQAVKINYIQNNYTPYRTFKDTTDRLTTLITSQGGELGQIKREIMKLTGIGAGNYQAIVGLRGF